MTAFLPEVIALVMGVALNLYVLLAGADFGGGVWDLFATGPRRQKQRALIAHAIGPIWEANHVWLVFALVVFFASFPPAFSAYMIALHIPLSVALIGIVLRGSAFAFRSYGGGDGAAESRWGAVFAAASTVTPFVLGICVGAVAAERIHLVNNIPVHGFFGSWLAPFPIAVGFLTVALFSLLAAVYLTMETADRGLREDFRARALLAAVVTGVLAVIAALLSEEGTLQGRKLSLFSSHALPFHILTGASAIGVIVCLWVRKYPVARILVGLQASLILWGWLASQYPYFAEPELSIRSAAAPDASLRVVLVATAIGAVIVLPSFVMLFQTFRKFRGPGAHRLDAGP